MEIAIHNPQLLAQMNALSQAKGNAQAQVTESAETSTLIHV